MYSIEDLVILPESIWDRVKAELDSKYDGWFGIFKQTVVNMVRKTRAKLGFGDAIGTVEKANADMRDSNRRFLQCSAWYPHPTEPEKAMRLMAFGNPCLFGLLKVPGVALFVDATFSICPLPFKQCLIIMVYDHSISAYVLVMYILMTHKVSSDQHLTLQLVSNRPRLVPNYLSF